VSTDCTTSAVGRVPDELDNDRAMDVFYADLLPADMPLADYEDADGNLRRRESDSEKEASQP
jgi:hypothetical protein